MSEPEPLKPRVLEMGSPASQRYVVSDFQSPEANAWRWSAGRPTVKFEIDEKEDFTYILDFVITESTFSTTGPVTIEFFINDHILGSTPYTRHGQYHYEKAVPVGWIESHKDTLVGAEVDQVKAFPMGGVHLGLIHRIGLKVQ